ncbi:MAG: hypothetical protein ACE5G8_03415, partial [Anaerolineae bacterium]
TMVDKLDTLRLERPLSADELGTPYAEGYLFVEVGSARRVYVAWTTTLDAPGRLRVDAPAVLVSDKLSSQLAMEPPLPVFDPYTLSDEADGAHDGVTLVPFHSSPIYVEVLP